jgi:peroxiredoxin
MCYPWASPVLLIAFGGPWAADEPAVGTRVQVSGRLTQVAGSGAAGDDTEPDRTFRGTFVVSEARDRTRVVLWTIEDLAGDPRVAWLQRFGTVELDQHLLPGAGGPTISAERDEAVREIPVRPPFFGPTERLGPDAQFEWGKLRYEVVGREEVSGRRAWRVQGSTSLGVRESLWIDEQTRLIVQMKQAVFLGQGVPHELLVRVDKTDSLDAAALAREHAAATALTAFRAMLPTSGDGAAQVAERATPELLQAARKVHGTIQGAYKGSVYEGIARDAIRDLEAGLLRANSLKQLAAKSRGKRVPEFTLSGTRGGKHAYADFKGTPLVLHFWEYRKEPLVAPYGEVGYLDFLWRQRQKQGVKVLGVAADPRLRDEQTRAQARKEIREFCDFMNVSYPIAFDETGLIDTFGDPRKVSGKLPLYVVIGADGSVAEYHAGLWGRSSDEGLKELDGQLLQLLKK